MLPAYQSISIYFTARHEPNKRNTPRSRLSPLYHIRSFADQRRRHQGSAIQLQSWLQSPEGIEKLTSTTLTVLFLLSSQAYKPFHTNTITAPASEHAPQITSPFLYRGASFALKTFAPAKPASWIDMTLNSQPLARVSRNLMPGLTMQRERSVCVFHPSCYSARTV